MARSSNDRSQTSGRIGVHFKAQPLLADRGTVYHRDLVFDEFLGLEASLGVEHLPYQISTARNLLQYFCGRLLLANEIGLAQQLGLPATF